MFSRLTFQVESSILHGRPLVQLVCPFIIQLVWGGRVRLSSSSWMEYFVCFPTHPAIDQLMAMANITVTSHLISHHAHGDRRNPLRAAHEDCVSVYDAPSQVVNRIRLKKYERHACPIIPLILTVDITMHPSTSTTFLLLLCKYLWPVCIVAPYLLLHYSSII